MRVRICKKVEIDTEVFVSTEDICQALQEAIDEGCNNPSERRAVQRMVTACWEVLTAMNEDQICAIGPANRPMFANALRKLADKFEG